MKTTLTTIQVLLIIVLGWNAIEYQRKFSESYLRGYQKGRADSSFTIQTVKECIEGISDVGHKFYSGDKLIAHFTCDDLRKINKVGGYIFTTDINSEK